MSSYMLTKSSDVMFGVHRKKSDEYETNTKKCEPKKSRKVRMSLSLLPDLGTSHGCGGGSPNRMGGSPTRQRSGHSKVVRCAASSDTQIDWHAMLAITFESFLLQIDEVLTKLRKEKRANTAEFVLRIENYQDICEKLRSEILIAVDKIDLLIHPPSNNEIEKQADFLQTMSQMTRELAKLRGQYHQAIKKFAPKMDI